MTLCSKPVLLVILQADGRDIHSGMIYAYLMASLMLGSAIAAMLLCGPFNLRPESFLPLIFVAASLALLVPAYDHQVLGSLISPSFARQSSLISFHCVESSPAVRLSILIPCSR